MTTKSGIYKITCIPTSKIYVGSGVSLSSRKSNHFKELSRGKHFNTHLQRAWNKYGGVQSFCFEIIELCDTKLLVEKEQHYIDTLQPHFNQRKDATNNKGVKRPDLSERNKKYRGNDKPVYQIDPLTFDIIKRFDSCSDAERKLKVPAQSIANTRRRKYLIYGNIWMLVEEYSKEKVLQFIEKKPVSKELKEKRSKRASLRVKDDKGRWCKILPI